MSIYYPTSDCAGGVVPDYTCNPCPDYEYGRIRSVALIKLTYVDTLIAAPTDSSLWSAGVDAGDVVVIYKTQGSYDGGATQELTGFGDDSTFNGNTTHTLVYRDPNYSDNCDFYNAIRGSSEYTVAYRTSSKIHFAESSVVLTPKNAVQDDINSVLSWEVTVKWTNPDSPCAVDVPDNIFDTCFVNG